MAKKLDATIVEVSFINDYDREFYWTCAYLNLSSPNAFFTLSSAKRHCRKVMQWIGVEPKWKH